MTDPRRRVRLLAAALLCSAAVGGWFLPHQSAGPTFGWALLLLPGFVLADLLVVHFEIGDQAHTATLTEIPLVLGLLSTDLRWVVLARIIAGGSVFAARRQPVLKWVFNVSQFAFSTTAAALLFSVLRPRAHGGILDEWGTATAAAVLASVCGAVAVLLAIRLTQGPVAHLATGLLRASSMTAIAASTLGVLVESTLRADGSSFVLMVLIGSAGVLTYRGHTRLRTRHERLRSLYDFLSDMGPAAGGREVTQTLLERSQRLLKAEHASLILYGDAAMLDAQPASGTVDGTVASLTDGQALLLEPLVLGPEQWPVSHAVLDGGPLLVRRGTRDPGLAAWVERLGVRDAVLVPLPADAGVRGALLVAGRRTDVHGFGQDDVDVLQGLANHAAVALRSGSLVDQLLFDSRHDPLTGLANRVEFSLRVELAAKRALETTRPQAVLLMDLDRFKDVNDSLGHHAGDHLLQQVAGRLRECLRAGDTVARLGGDEFAVLLVDTGEEQARRVAEQLCLAVRQGVDVDGVVLEVEASVGIAVTPGHGDDAVTLLRHADIAMYTAKGGPGIQLFDPASDDLGAQRLALISDLRRALTEPARAGEIYVVYQPQCDGATGLALGVEALTRWQHPELGLVPPDTFVPLAESANLVPMLTDLVLNASLRQIAEWDRLGHPLALSVNLSARDLLTPDLVMGVRSALSRSGVLAERLTLEITESTLMSDRRRSVDMLADLRGTGVRLSVDDFGTGYSSLAYLKELPVQEVKIDRSFVRSIASDAADEAIVTAVIRLAHSLGLSVVAEGVEDEACWRVLASLGCDIVQGYHFAKPLPSAALEGWLHAQSGRESKGRAAHLRSVSG